MEKFIGDIIRFHRKMSGLSLIKLALLAGVGKTALFDLEHGKETIKLATLSKVLKVLNINMTFESPLMDKYRKTINANG